MKPIPNEQLDAIAQFWANQYQYSATDEQLESFKAKLKQLILEDLELMPWDESVPLFGSYLRRFLTCVEYAPCQNLESALKAAHLQCDSLAFPWGLVLSIDPGCVKIHSNGFVIWEIQARDR